jgi:hypothetical protein
MNRRTNLKSFLLISVFLLAMAGSAQARTITVGHGGGYDCNTIQAAINDANDYDEIEVVPGTYNEGINFNGKAVRLYSSGGPEVTTIDGTGYYDVVKCISGEDANTILEGFTITGASDPPGPEDGGVGMLNSGSSPTVINCTFSNNRGYSGGMYNYQNSPTVVNCRFIGNICFEGGGMHNYESSPSVTNCTFSDNLAQDRGGGMENWNNSSPIVTNCTFTGNSADFGGGMYNWNNSNPTVVNCSFSNNRGISSGGGMEDGNSSPTVTNCTFSANHAHTGGGMYNWYNSSPTVTNCTFSNNTSNYGGGMYNYNSSPTVTNCILWGNTPDEIVDNQSSSTVSYSDIQGGWIGEGNIDADPYFADPCNGDYHLKSQAGRWDPNSESWVIDANTSPCIDAGNPGCPLGVEPNNPNNIRVNMGAYGGTAEASKSPADWRNIADLTNDWTVDFNDLKVFVGYWLETGECIPSDLNRSQAVDFVDVAIFCKQWSDTSAIEPGIVYQVDDCNMGAGQNSAVAWGSGETRFSVRVEGDYIHFEDLITANCCIDEIELLMTVEDNLITIHEIEHLTMACPCMCKFPVTARLGPFEEGNYLVEVIDVNGSSLGVVEVTIGEPVAPSITYQIEDCNREASGLFAEEESIQIRFTVTVEGSYIHFEDIMPANCCPDELELQMTVEENLITIYETEYTSEGCRCMCTFPVTATLGPFEPGTYSLEVYQDGGFIGSTTVIIGPTDF